MLFRFIQKVFVNFLLYLSLLSFFVVNKNIFNASGVIGQKLNFSEYTKIKSQDLIKKIQHQNLAMNFLFNQRTLNDDEKIAFQSSGLIHLLAVSGAQIIPICELVSVCMMQFFYFVLRRYFVSSCLMKIIFYIKYIIVISASFLMTGLFSCTGALLRVTFLSSLNEFLKSQKYLYYVSYVFPVISNSVVRRVVLLILVSILFGNMFFDYSFLLSSIGGAILEIASVIIRTALKKSRIHPKIKTILQSILLSLLTSFLISMILYPVSRVSFLLSMFSNIFAAPIVTFIITPLSLILLFMPTGFLFRDPILKTFDWSLGSLNFIAQHFQDLNYELQIPKILLFSDEGKFYLILLLMILFSIIDAIRSIDEEYLRNVFAPQ